VFYKLRAASDSDKAKNRKMDCVLTTKLRGYIMTDTLVADQQLNINEHLDSNNGKVQLIMQGDGNLVLYRTDNHAPLWASDTWDKPVTHAVMQGDGNFVCYSDAGQAFWATGTWDQPGNFIVLQDDGNLVVYNGTVPRWASNTVQDWNPEPTVVVPNVEGLGIKYAAQALGAAGLNWKIMPPALSSNPHTEVHKQAPKSGARVKRRSIVTLTVVRTDL
jgi:hypothetical protein